MSRVRASTALVIVLLAAGCAAQSASPPTAGTQTAVSPTAETPAAVSRARSYDSLAQLSADSTAIVVATVGNPRRAGAPGGGPVTLLPLKQVEVVAGALRPSDVLRQIGGGGVTVADGGAQLVPGRRYLLWLRPFFFVAGDDTGQVQVTGAFALTPDGRYARVDEESAALPAVVDEEQARRAAGRLQLAPGRGPTPASAGQPTTAPY